MDVLAEFMEDRCIGPSFTVVKKQLYTDYVGGVRNQTARRVTLSSTDSCRKGTFKARFRPNTSTAKNILYGYGRA